MEGPLPLFAKTSNGEEVADMEINEGPLFVKTSRGLRGGCSKEIGLRHLEPRTTRCSDLP